MTSTDPKYISHIERRSQHFDSLSALRYGHHACTRIVTCALFEILLTAQDSTSFLTSPEFENEAIRNEYLKNLLDSGIESGIALTTILKNVSDYGTGRASVKNVIDDLKKQSAQDSQGLPELIKSMEANLNIGDDRALYTDERFKEFTGQEGSLQDELKLLLETESTVGFAMTHNDHTTGFAKFTGAGRKDYYVFIDSAVTLGKAEIEIYDNLDAFIDKLTTVATAGLGKRKRVMDAVTRRRRKDFEKDQVDIAPFIVGRTLSDEHSAGGTQEWQRKGSAAAVQEAEDVAVAPRLGGGGAAQ